jgi:hypothetical protein
MDVSKNLAEDAFEFAVEDKVDTADIQSEKGN